MSFQKASLSYSLFHPLQMKKCSRKFFYADSIQGKRTSSPEIPFKADMVLERTVPQQALQEIRVRGFYEEKMLTQRRREICVSAPLVSHAAYPSLGTKPAGGQVAIRTRENRWARQGTTPRAQPKVPLMEPRSKQNTPVGVEGRLMPTFGRAC